MTEEQPQADPTPLPPPLEGVAPATEDNLVDIGMVVCAHIDQRLEDWIPAVAERVVALRSPAMIELITAVTAVGDVLEQHTEAMNLFLEFQKGLAAAPSAPLPTATPYREPLGDAARVAPPPTPAASGAAVPEPEHAGPEEAAELAELERVVAHRRAAIDHAKESAANDVEPGVAYWQQQAESLEKVLPDDIERRDRCKARLAASQ